MTSRTDGSVLICDYYIVRRGNLHIPSLFDAKGNNLNPNGVYMHKPWGINGSAPFHGFSAARFPFPVSA